MPKSQKVVFANELTEWLERFSGTFMNTQEVIEIENEEDCDDTVSNA